MNKPTFSFLGCCILFAAALPSFAAPLLRFSSQAELSSKQLTFPIMQNAKPLPAPTVQRLLYRISNGTDTWETYLSPFYDLWFSHQLVASWIDAEGNTLRLAEVSLKYPADFSKTKKLSESDFEAWSKHPSNALSADASPDELEDWAQRFTERRVFEGYKPVPKPPQRLSHLALITFAKGRELAWIFQFDNTFPSQQNVPQTLWCLTFKAHDDATYDPKWLMRETYSAILQRIIPKAKGSIHASGRAFHEAATGEKVNPHRRLRSSATKDVLIEDAQRERAQKSVSSLPDWWFMDSPSYILLSNDPKAEISADKLLTKLESLRVAFSKRVPILKSVIPATSVIRLLRTDEEYVRYLTDGDVPHRMAERSSGLFDGSRNELIIRPENKRAISNREEVVQHEAFHQFISQAWRGITPPAWFNEGCAEYFESCVNQIQNRWTHKPNPYVKKQLMEYARDKDFFWEAYYRDLLRWDYNTFYNPPDLNSTKSYFMAYALVEYLFSVTENPKPSPYKKILPTFYKVLEETGDPNRATDAAFNSATDFPAFINELRRYWRNGGR